MNPRLRILAVAMTLAAPSARAEPAHTPAETPLQTTTPGIAWHELIGRFSKTGVR